MTCYLCGEINSKEIQFSNGSKIHFCKSHLTELRTICEGLITS